MKRRLSAILAADVVGYSRLMRADETGTLAALGAHRKELFEPEIGEHDGRIVKLMGDGILAEFSSVLDAVHCAVAIQQTLAELNADTAPDQRLEFRMGINLGDVLVEDDDIYGDGVNVAARLEGLAEPGGICISETVYQQIKGKLDVALEDLGEQRVKNIAEPLRVYRVGLAPAAPGDSAAAGGSLTLPDKPSIAVLPFTNMSGDPQQDYFSDGMTEDIITELSRFRSLFVIARNSAFTYKGRAVNVGDVGRELGVQYVVEGSVRKAGERIRVTAQLVDAVSGNHVWAERFDRDLADIFAVQDEITQTVAATIGGRVEAEGRQRASRLHETNLKAYDTILRGQALYYEISRQAYHQARELLEKAIALDPHSARAHMLLGAVYDMGFWTNWDEDPDRALERARQFGKKAVLLDDTDSLAHAHLGEILFHSRKFTDAEIQFQKAIALNPNDVAARALYGSFLARSSHNDEAIEQFTIAKQLDPFELGWVTWLRGTALFTFRRYDEAIAELKKVETPINPARAWLAASCAHAGRLEDARSALRTFLEVGKEDMAVFPEALEDWEAFWRKGAEYDNEDDFQHFFGGLLKAGLKEEIASSN